MTLGCRRTYLMDRWCIRFENRRLPIRGGRLEESRPIAVEKGHHSYMQCDVIEGDAHGEWMIRLRRSVFVDNVDVANGQFQIPNHLKLHTFHECIIAFARLFSIFFREGTKESGWMSANKATERVSLSASFSFRSCSTLCTSRILASCCSFSSRLASYPTSALNENDSMDTFFEITQSTNPSSARPIGKVHRSWPSSDWCTSSSKELEG